MSDAGRYEKYVLLPQAKYERWTNEKGSCEEREEEHPLKEFARYAGAKQSHKARLLLEELEKHGVRVEDDGRIILGDRGAIADSHFLDVFKNLLNASPRASTAEQPRGARELYAYLTTRNFPTSLIPNRDARERIKFDAQPVRGVKRFDSEDIGEEREVTYDRERLYP